MDEDQPATQPHLSPAEQAALEEARLKTADDSFAGNQSATEVAPQAQATTPLPTSTKKVVINPVNDMSAYSTSPNIPVTTQTQTAMQEVAVTAPPANSQPSSSVGDSTLSPPATAAANPAVEYNPAAHSSWPQHPVEDEDSSQTANNRVASYIPIVKWWSFVLIAYGLYLMYQLVRKWLRLRGYDYTGAPLRVLLLIPNLQFLIYGLYFLFAKSLRNVSGVLLSQIIISLTGLVESSLLLAFWSDNDSDALESLAYMTGLIYSAVIVIVAALARSQVNKLDDEKRNL
ncbi:hypothetical protein IPL68_01230 [Candidatus Saccharibacteria bacterium]|nr:MAG: hypothetical protein IPL68_01230 [Candidatus Saccharibacteria bacterium]